MSQIKKIEEDTFKNVLSRVEVFRESNELHLPDNYSPANAIKSAWLILQETKTSNKKPVTCANDRQIINS